MMVTIKWFVLGVFYGYFGKHLVLDLLKDFGFIQGLRRSIRGAS